MRLWIAAAAAVALAACGQSAGGSGTDLPPVQAGAQAPMQLPAVTVPAQQAQLTAEQRTRVRQTVLAGANVPRVDSVNFSVSVGTLVPSSVRVIAVPQTLIAIHPEWRGHLYFVVHDDIIILDDNRRIVAVVAV